MADLSEAKQRLLQQRLGARPGAGRVEAAIPRHGEATPPLSTGQAALLHEYRSRPEEPVYNIVHAYTISGTFDVDRFRDALRSVVERHETLRTTFGAERLTLTVDDAVEVDEIDGIVDGAFDRIAVEEAGRRFDLTRGPLVRATIARLGDDRHGLVLGVHHVVSDAASLAVLWADLAAAYEGRALGELPTGYGDHAAWQAARIDDADRAFWLDHLGDDPTSVDLPLERPRLNATDGYLTRRVAVPAEELHSRGHRPLPFFLSVFAALLQRYSDTDDVVVGTIASTRDHTAVQPLIGYFLNILPLRLDVDPADTVATTVEATDATIARALPHRHVPYSDVVAALRRNGATNPDVARVMFVLDESHAPQLAGCEIAGRLVHPGPSVTDLTVFVRPSGAEFDVSAEWSGERFHRRDIEALTDEFASMAAWAARHGDAPWTTMPAAPDMLGPELDTELVPIPTAIARNVGSARRPALRCGDRRLDTDDLLALAEHIRAGLARRAVVPGDRVGVMLDRSTELVAAMLAIQMQGAAYVPLDPSYPDARLAHLVEVAAPRLTIVDASHAGRLPSSTISIDELASPDGATNGTPPSAPPAVALDDPAYVIFTSGSTGRPRGVAVDQRRLAASTSARDVHYDDSPERFLVVSSVGFDSSIVGLWWTLARGGEVVLPTEAQVHDIDALGELIEAAGVTHTLLVPSLYRALLTRSAAKLRSLRHVIVAGEACPATLVDTHFRLLPGTALWNEYGPTEATVWATVHRCRPGDGPVPIGRPIPGATARVADRWGRPRPAGASGELLVGGAGVTDGYLDAPEQTAAAFIDGAGPVGRLYRTGDLVRVDEASRLRFLGRRDHQLSVSGLRIEAGEIEQALTAAPAVGAAIVRVERQLDTDPLRALAELSTEDVSALLADASAAADPAAALAASVARHGAGRDVLVAYVEPADAVGPDAIDPAALMQNLRANLPAAAVPSEIEVLARLPRGEHGKLDRAALPPPLRHVTIAANASTELLDVLVSAWRQVLGTTGLGPDSDFFVEGGDSLRAVELAAVVEAHLGRRVPISALMDGRTPRRLATAIGDSSGPNTQGAGGIDRRSYVVPLRPAGDATPLIVLPPGGGHLLVFDPLVQLIDPDVPVYGFDLPGSDRDDELPTSIEHLCDTYLPQLRTLQPTGPYRFLGWSFGGVAALELARRLRAAGDEVELIGMIDTLVPGLQRANRSRAYLDLARAGEIGGITRKLGQMVRNRWALRTTARLAGKDDERPLDPEQRRMWVTMQVDAFVERYRPHPYDGRVVFFAAQDTYPWRTTEPWSELLADLEIVEMDGTHEGDDGLLGGRHAERIAAVMSDRLA